VYRGRSTGSLGVMTSAPRKRPKIGDIIEIPTPAGLAYAQYTHRHTARPKFGALLRVFSGLHAIRPTSFGDIVKGPVQFSTFFPLGASCNRGIVQVVGSEPIPAEAQPFLTFRSGMRGADGKVAKWWLWDGAKSWPIGKLKDAQRAYPIRSVWNYALLVHRIVSGWRPEHHT
jgi:hypothetical protein